MYHVIGAPLRLPLSVPLSCLLWVIYPEKAAVGRDEIIFGA